MKTIKDILIEEMRNGWDTPPQNPPEIQSDCASGGPSAGPGAAPEPRIMVQKKGTTRGVKPIRTTIQRIGWRDRNDLDRGQDQTPGEENNKIESTELSIKIENTENTERSERI